MYTSIYILLPPTTAIHKKGLYTECIFLINRDFSGKRSGFMLRILHAYFYATCSRSARRAPRGMCVVVVLQGNTNILHDARAHTCARRRRCMQSAEQTDISQESGLFVSFLSNKQICNPFLANGAVASRSKASVIHPPLFVRAAWVRLPPATQVKLVGLHAGFSVTSMLMGGHAKHGRYV